jgi:hypothetical protein
LSNLAGLAFRDARFEGMIEQHFFSIAGVSWEGEHGKVQR